ncbi:MAG TPA: exodeoxyribonuclease VII large subunit [Alphaproteobacteria bacterium]|nr:exodeoxyribonuclease VII large subunit [Alphaproteobacteria bacterium]
MSENSAPEPALRANLPEYTVSEISAAVKRTVEDNFGWVRVRGEVSRPTIPGSGHCYLRLKDENAVLDAVIWKGTLARLGMRPEEGMEVVCTGRLTTYPGKSSYQLVVDRMELAGEGALLKLIEDRKKKLAAEGLFDLARKKKLPRLPEVIGVVTSPTGAVIRDILHRLNDRFPRRVLLWPVAVQGEGAAEQIAAAIAGFNMLAPGGKVPRPDVLIVARGGGSLEDLMAFNEEIVVRAAAASDIPLISAVGHETDTTLIDFAASVRAPTPTAAAEMAVPVRAELLADLLKDARRLVNALQRRVTEGRARLEGLARALGDPRRVIEERAQRLDERGERLRLAFANLLHRRIALIAELGARLPHPRIVVDRARQRAADLAARLAASRLGALRTIAQGLERTREFQERAQRAMRRGLTDRGRDATRLAQLLESFSYQRVLERGFVLVHDPDGRAVTSAATARRERELALRFGDGEIGVRVEAEAARPAKETRPRRSKPPGSQGSLL